MHDTILTSDDGLYRVVASDEHDAESPRWGAEFGLMFAEHPRYDLGDQHVGVLAEIEAMSQDGDYTLVDIANWLVTEHGTSVILPLYLHDHSGLSIRAGGNLLAGGGLERGGWDTSMIGAIFDTAANRMEWLGDVETLLRAEVEEYDMYLQGRVYVLSVEQKVQEVRRSAFTYPDRVEMRDSLHTHWETVPDAGVHTTYGESGHAQIAADMLCEFVPATVQVEG